MEKTIEINNSILPTKEKKLFTFLVIFLMFGNVYVFPLVPVLGMGEFVFILFIPYFLFRMKKSFTAHSRNKGFLLFMLYGFVISLIMSVFFQAGIIKVFSRLIRDFFYFFIIFFLGNRFFSKETFFKLLVIFSVALSAFVILQSIVFLIFGYFIPGFPLTMRINDGGHVGRELYNAYLVFARDAGYLKPNGFLCEPAQCFFVALIMLFFYSKIALKKLIPLVTVISIAAVLTMSTSAFIYVATAWIMWLIKEGKRNVLIVGTIIVLIGIGAFVLYNRGIGASLVSVLNRFTNLFTGARITDSTSLRIEKGLIIFRDLPWQYKFFGIGFGTYTAAYQQSIISQNVVMASNEYMNSFSYIWVSSGIIGGIVMLFSFLRVYHSSDFLGKVMIIALVIMSLGAAVYSSPICVWAMLVILDSHKHENNVNNTQ